MLLDDVKMVNCARCGKDLLGESMANLKDRVVQISFWTTDTVALPPMVRGRVNGRPYCKWCHRAMTGEIP